MLLGMRDTSASDRLGDDPSLIPTEDFTRNGRHYYLLDMTRKDEVGVDVQTH